LTTIRKVKIKWLLAATAVVCIGLSVYYADLLKAAFTLNPIPRSPESIARGREIFQHNCVVCHGIGGRGDGVVAASLPTRPKDLSRLAPPPIFPDGVIAYRIANGVNVMPAWKTVLSEHDIWDLINFIRSLSLSTGK
jgi:copper resistance protein D